MLFSVAFKAAKNNFAPPILFFFFSASFDSDRFATGQAL
jgi:hypothetical protein